jgi:hypothetical protein
MNVPPSVSLFHFDYYEPMPIHVEVSNAPLTSDAGLLPLRQFDDGIGLTSQFAAALHDSRDPDLIEHTFLEMVRSRVFGILAGYEDQNDHDTLRADPVFKLVADRSPEDDDLASQPTLSRAKKLKMSRVRLWDWARRGWVHYRRTAVQKVVILWADPEEIRRLQALLRSKRRCMQSYPTELTTPKERAPQRPARR